MTPRERLLFDITKNISHAADMLNYDAHNLKRTMIENEGHTRVFTVTVEQRVASLRKTMDVLTDQLAMLKILEKV